MVKTPFGIPVLMMPMLLPCMPIILPAWGAYKAILGGDKPMKPERLASITSSMCCLMLLSYLASKSPVKTPPVMLATCVMSILSSCSSSVITIDLKKRAEALIRDDKKKK
jgi:hypothetical protein